MTESLPDGPLVSVDLGAARIGLAACDSGRHLAYPIGRVAAGDGWTERLVAAIADHRPVALIVGYPLALDGSPQVAARRVLVQARQLAAASGLPVWLADERLTTAEAHRRLREAGHSARTDRSMVDAQAAVGILETVLQSLEHGRFIGRELEMEETHG